MNPAIFNAIHIATRPLPLSRVYGGVGGSIPANRPYTWADWWDDVYPFFLLIGIPLLVVVSLVVYFKWIHVPAPLLEKTGKIVQVYVEQSRGDGSGRNKYNHKDHLRVRFDAGLSMSFDFKRAGGAPTEFKVGDEYRLWYYEGYDYVKKYQKIE